MTKNLNKTGKRGASVYTGKKTVKNLQLKKKHFGDGFFDSGFFCVQSSMGSCLATSTKKPECEKNPGFFMPVKMPLL